MDQQNGEQQKIAQLPVIAVLWDEKSQVVHLQFDGGENGAFKRWEFVLAVLDMARRKAEDGLKMTQLANLQKQVAEQQQAQAIAAQLEKQKIRV